LLSTGLGSNPSIATLIGFFINSIASGVIYDVFAQFTRSKERNDFMKILCLGLGVVCGNMV